MKLLFAGKSIVYDMTYNVFGGTLNLAQSNPVQSYSVHCCWNWAIFQHM